MAYQLKSTGIAANCIMCIAVDPDTGTIKDFASAAVTADMTVGASVTIGTQTFDGITRHFWQPGAGTADADFVKFGTNKPNFTINAANPNRTVVWVGQTDTAGISRFFGADGSNNYFAHLNIASGDSTHPALSAASNSYHGAQANPVNAKRICGWALTRGSTRVWYTAADTDSAMTTGSAALGNIDASYSLDYVDRVNSGTTHQRQKTHFLLQFNTALTQADFDALRDDAFGTLLESAGGGITGSSSITLGDVTTSAAGTVVSGIVGTSAITLDAITQSSAGTVTGSGAINGASSITLGGVGSSSAGTVTTPSLTFGPFKNNTGSVLASLSVAHAVVMRASDRTQTLSLSSQSTNGSGYLTISSTSLTPGTVYMLAAWNADGTAAGIKRATAAP